MKVTNCSQQLISYVGRRQGQEVAKHDIAADDEKAFQCRTPDEHVITFKDGLESKKMLRVTQA